MVLYSLPCAFYLVFDSTKEYKIEWFNHFWRHVICKNFGLLRTRKRLSLHVYPFKPFAIIYLVCPVCPISIQEDRAGSIQVSSHWLLSLISLKLSNSIWDGWIKLRSLWILCISHIVSWDTCLRPGQTYPTLNRHQNQEVNLFSSFIILLGKSKIIQL